MGTFATITLPVKGNNVIAIGDVIARFPGTGTVAVDAAGTTVTFELHFPGKLSALVDRLNDNHIAVGPQATVSIPVTSLVPEKLADADHVFARLNFGGEVWDPEFVPAGYVSEARLAGNCVEATIQTRTEALHQLYDGMLDLGLVGLPSGAPLQTAGPALNLGV